MLYAIGTKLLRGIESLLYRRADRIIALSEGVGKYIAGRGVNPEKISLLPNGVYLEQFEVTEDRTSVRARLDLLGKFVVMYAGAHGLANALDMILGAGYLMEKAKIGERRAENRELHALSPKLYALCSEVAFVLVGDGPCKGELQQIVNEKRLNNVKMLPAVPKNYIPNLLNAADALVITLRSLDLFSYGVSPNKLFEYMASGKPILCAVNGRMAELVTRANAGIAVEPENPEALVCAILSLAGDSKRRSIYGANGRKFVAENFSRSRIVEGLISILDV
jgi:glycosyltransferase involved in cell wall biosynthesis